ncbi:MAG: hypothetical protein GY811_04990 [Myxococcales bacterium]|nr:hypothetical protein [Myxococcales bacterium]
MRLRSRLTAGAIVFLATACGGKTTRTKVTAANVALGDCADPERSGVLSASPSLRNAHRDLNGDGQVEKVFADRNLCASGNCSWNLFTRIDECSRYIGTVSGASLEIGRSQGEGGFSPIRAWWRLPKGERHLVHNYHFRNGAYQLEDVLLCRQEGDDRLLCASEEPHVVQDR